LVSFKTPAVNRTGHPLAVGGTLA